MSDLPFTSITELGARVKQKQVSPREIVAALLERIDAHDDQYRYYITVCHDAAATAAADAEKAVMAGDWRGPLHGIPVTHKDNIFTRGVRTTGHSRLFADYVPDYDATAAARLTDAGMILLGKANTPEFACGTMDLFGLSRNPWNLELFTGASSSGSAGAVAAGLAVAATGTDTAGSTRAPSSFCGVVGLKPTYGRMSRYGLMPLSWSMDQIGPITRTVKDCALMFQYMAGHDPLDAMTAREPVPDCGDSLFAGLENLHGRVVGVPENHFFAGLHPDIARAVAKALESFAAAGARLEGVTLAGAGDLAAAGNLLVMAEAYAAHAPWLRERGREYGGRTRRRITAGAFYTAAEYQEANAIRRQWIEELARCFQTVDLIITPTLPFPAFDLTLQREGRPPDTSWGTRHANLSGYPALTLPCGFTDDGLPVGLQIMARPFAEDQIFKAAYVYEQQHNWHRQRPPDPEGEK
ncbi:MAG: amidase [Thermaerobacterales bacterium]